MMLDVRDRFATTSHLKGVHYIAIKIDDTAVDTNTQRRWQTVTTSDTEKSSKIHNQSKLAFSVMNPIHPGDHSGQSKEEQKHSQDAEIID